MRFEKHKPLPTLPQQISYINLSFKRFTNFFFFLEGRGGHILQRTSDLWENEAEVNEIATSYDH